MVSFVLFYKVFSFYKNQTGKKSLKAIYIFIISQYQNVICFLFLICQWRIE